MKNNKINEWIKTIENLSNMNNAQKVVLSIAVFVFWMVLMRPVEDFTNWSSDTTIIILTAVGFLLLYKLWGNKKK
jgi:hypothetical protein